MTAVRTLPLDRSDSVTLDGSGNGTIRLRPDGPDERWRPESAAVKVRGATGTPEAACAIYIGPAPTDPYFVDKTGSGAFGDATGRVAAHTVARHAAPYIWAVWTGGEPGATATLRVTGTKEVP